VFRTHHTKGAASCESAFFIRVHTANLAVEDNSTLKNLEIGATPTG
jgi:hypothetical protein